MSSPYLSLCRSLCQSLLNLDYVAKQTNEWTQTTQSLLLVFTAAIFLAKKLPQSQVTSKDLGRGTKT